MFHVLYLTYIKQIQQKIAKPLFEILSQISREILSCVARQAPTKDWKATLSVAATLLRTRIRHGTPQDPRIKVEVKRGLGRSGQHWEKRRQTRGGGIPQTGQTKGFPLFSRKVLVVSRTRPSKRKGTNWENPQRIGKVQAMLQGVPFTGVQVLR